MVFPWCCPPSLRPWVKASGSLQRRELLGRRDWAPQGYGGAPERLPAPAPAPVHPYGCPGSPQIRPEALVLTRKARDCPSPRPLQAALARVPWAQCHPASQMSPPSIPQARQDRCALPSPRPGPGEPAPCAWAPTLPGRWLLRPVASPAATSSFGPPAPSAHCAVATRCKPGRPPVLRLPDQVAPAAASAPPAAGIPASSEAPSPHCASVFSSAKVSLSSTSPSVGCCVQTAGPAPPAPSLSPRPQIADRRAGPRTRRGRIRSPGGVRRGFSRLEGRTSCAKPARDWRRVPGLGKQGLQHPVLGRARARLTLQPPWDSSAKGGLTLSQPHFLLALLGLDTDRACLGTNLPTQRPRPLNAGPMTGDGAPGGSRPGCGRLGRCRPITDLSALVPVPAPHLRDLTPGALSLGRAPNLPPGIPAEPAPF